MLKNPFEENGRELAEKESTEKWKSPVCEHCRQTTQYTLTLNRGAAEILVAMATAVYLKKRNEIHLVREMEIMAKDWNIQKAIDAGVITSNHSSNAGLPRAHGLIARIDGKEGFYCLTRKGGTFLRGEPVPKIAIMAKSTADDESHQIGYLEPDHLKTTIRELLAEGARWWSGPNPYIENLLHDPNQTRLF